MVREKIETDSHETLETAKIALAQYSRMLAREIPKAGPTTPLFALPPGTTSCHDRRASAQVTAAAAFNNGRDRGPGHARFRKLMDRGGIEPPTS